MINGTYSHFGLNAKEQDALFWFLKKTASDSKLSKAEWIEYDIEKGRKWATLDYINRFLGFLATTEKAYSLKKDLNFLKKTLFKELKESLIFFYETNSEVFKVEINVDEAKKSISVNVSKHDAKSSEVKNDAVYAINYNS